MVAPKGALGVDLQVPRQVDEREEHVAHLLLDGACVAARDGRVELAELLGHLRARALRASSQSKPTRATFSPMRWARVSAGMLRGTPPRMPALALLLAP